MTTVNAFHWRWLTVQKFCLLSSWLEAWWHVGRHGAGEVAERSTSGSSGSRKRQGASRPILKFWSFKTHPSATLHPQGHASWHCDSLWTYERYFHSNHHTQFHFSEFQLLQSQFYLKRWTKFLEINSWWVLSPMSAFMSEMLKCLACLLPPSVWISLSSRMLTLHIPLSFHAGCSRSTYPWLSAT